MKSKNSSKKTCTPYIFHLTIFQSLAQEDSHKMIIKFPVLSYRDYIEKDVHLQLKPSLPLSTFALPPQGYGHPLRMPPN